MTTPQRLLEHDRDSSALKILRRESTARDLRLDDQLAIDQVA
ncbi:MAG: hypothetical protein U0325_08350 [Polyangiales bacterium]